MSRHLFQFGLRHEVAKRWPLQDWIKSFKVGKQIDLEYADLYISELILKNKPALIGRLGGTEARFLNEFKKISSMPILNNLAFKLKPNWNKRCKEINTNAGFYFQNLDEVNQFSNIYKSALINTDILGAWGTAFTSIESDYLDLIPKLIPVGYTAPWVQPYVKSKYLIPWSKSLQGMRVLVVNPFSESIQNQFSRIAGVFPNYNCHDFQLITLKSPMTINTHMPSKKSWFDYLEETKIQMSKLDFDIALISAGSYSYPLAHFAKQLGKIGIHAGGGLQLFFGVMGKRWDNSDYLIEMINANWTRPTSKETPESAGLVEGGCYW